MCSFGVVVEHSKVAVWGRCAKSQNIASASREVSKEPRSQQQCSCILLVAAFCTMYQAVNHSFLSSSHANTCHRSRDPALPFLYR
jgi:hypothetical protein